MLRYEPGRNGAEASTKTVTLYAVPKLIDCLVDIAPDAIFGERFTDDPAIPAPAMQVPDRHLSAPRCRHSRRMPGARRDAER